MDDDFEDAPYRVWLPAGPDLLNALLSSQRQKLYCDVILQTRSTENAKNDGQKTGVKDSLKPISVAAHRVVLASVSPYFKDEIENSRSPNKIIRLPASVDEVALKIIVEWIYGGLKEIEVICRPLCLSLVSNISSSLPTPRLPVLPPSPPAPLHIPPSPSLPLLLLLQIKP